MARHDLKCIVEHYERYGNKLLNEQKDNSEFVKGRGDGMLRVAATLRGEITGSDVIHDPECICQTPKHASYDHYEAS